MASPAGPATAPGRSVRCWSATTRASGCASGAAWAAGSTERVLERLTRQLRGLRQNECPFDPTPPRSYARDATWVKPVLVAEIAFAEWTSEGLVRQASFLELRDDKDAADVVREG